MKIFTIIAGLAGIISLFLPFISNLNKWKNYFFNFSFLSIGLAIGVIASMSEKALNSFTSNKLIQVVVLLSVLSVASFVAYLLIKSEKDMLGYLTLMITLGGFLPLNLEKINSQKNNIDTQDIIMLSKQYQDKGVYQKASSYLRIYKVLVEKDFSKEQIELIQKRIDYVDSLQLNSLK